jgi:leucyl/phenylalanyl-tRNA--protein transferase
MSLWCLDPNEIWFPYRNEMDGDRVAVGADLSWDRVVIGFRKACFPFYHAGDEIAWYSPEKRAVFFPHLMQLKRCEEWKRNPKGWEFCWDQDFDSVIQHCQRDIHSESNWLHEETIAMYKVLHQQGFAHALSVKSEGRLIGGLLGVAVGRMFYGLSMFHLEEGASKAALCYLISFLREKKWKLLDCQWMTPFLAQMGAVEIDREKFLDILNVQVKFRTPRGNWSQSLTWKNKDPFPKRSDHPVEWP